MKFYDPKIHLKYPSAHLDQRILKYLQHYPVITAITVRGLNKIYNNKHYIKTTLYKYLEKHHMHTRYTSFYWYKYGQINYIYRMDKTGHQTLVSANPDIDIIKHTLKTDIPKRIKKNNILVPPNPDNGKNMWYMYKGLAKSIKEHHNVLFIMNTTLMYNESNKGLVHNEIRLILHRNYHVPYKDIDRYHIYVDQTAKAPYISSQDITNIARYPHFLAEHQPFIFILRTDGSSQSYPDTIPTAGWDTYGLYVFNQIMDYVHSFPNINPNGLDVLIFDLCKFPVIRKLPKYMRDGILNNTRFLIGTNHMCQEAYSMGDGYNDYITDGEPFGIDNADETIFTFSTDLNLARINAKEGHKKMPNLNRYW